MGDMKSWNSFRPKSDSGCSKAKVIAILSRTYKVDESTNKSIGDTTSIMA